MRAGPVPRNFRGRDACTAVYAEGEAGVPQSTGGAGAYDDGRAALPIYEFRCENAHRHDHTLPMSRSDSSLPCPECGMESRRILSAPRLGRLGSAEAKLIARTESTAQTPGVVSRVPGAGNRAAAKVTRDPRHAKLPRP
jgi:putative FmdB family regulatory protein